MDTVELIKSVGFPIFMALLFYLDLRKVVKANTRAINGLTDQQYQLFKTIKRG